MRCTWSWIIARRSSHVLQRTPLHALPVTSRSSLFERRCTSGDMENHPFCVGLPLPPFFPPYMADMPSDLTDSWRSMGRMCFFPPFYFFFSSLLRVRCRVHSKRTSRIDRAECVCVCVWVCAPVFCVEESTREKAHGETTLRSRVITEMKVPGKTGDPRLRACRRPERARRLYKSNDDDFNPDIGLRDGRPWRRWGAWGARGGESLSRIRSFAIKVRFDPLKFGGM